MDPRTDLELLLAGQFDGEPDPERNRRLAELLRARPELQAEYLDHAQLHALLRWRAGQVMPPTTPAAGRDNLLRLQDAVPNRSRPRRARRALLVALVLLTAGSASLFRFPPPQEASETPAVLARLIDWNLDLSRTAAPAERRRLHAQEAAQLEAEVRRSPLSRSERDLAQTLLDNGEWLAVHNDPVAASNRFNDIADLLVAQMDAAATGNDPERLIPMADSYCRVAELGIDANISRALAAGGLDGDRQRRLERSIRRHAGRAARLAALLERTPVASHKHLRRAWQNSSKYGTRHKGDRRPMAGPTSREDAP